MIKSEGPQDFDPLAPETFDSPYDVYSDLRQRCPVAHSRAWNGFWALMAYDDVFAALQQSDTYISPTLRAQAIAVARSTFEPSI